MEKELELAEFEKVCDSMSVVLTLLVSVEVVEAEV